MKGYRQPKEFQKGICFLCKTPTDDEYSVVHVKCAIAFTDEKDKRKIAANEEAKQDDK